MSSREEYLLFLSEFGLSEDKVLPMFDYKAFFKKLVNDKLDDAIFLLMNLPTLMNYEISFKDVPGFTKNEKKMFDKFRKGLTKPSNTNELINFLHQELTKDFREFISSSIFESIYPGVFPTQSFNAQCTRRPNGYLILIDTGCFEILDIVNSIYVSEWNHKKKVEVFASIIKDYCLYKKIPGPFDLDIPGLMGREGLNNLLFSSHLVNAAESFILAHEYGHAVLGHLDKQPQRMMRGKIPIRVVNQTKYQEYEADIWATNALIQRSLKYIKDQDYTLLTIACFGVIFCLGCSLLIEEFLREKKGILIDSHPSSKDRIYMVNSFCELTNYSEFNTLTWKFLDFIGDVALILLNHSLSIPYFDTGLNQLLEKSLSQIDYDYERKDWLDCSAESHVQILLRSDIERINRYFILDRIR